MPTSEFPKMLSDPTGTQVPDRLVNNATEETAARMDGFTVEVPIPAKTAPVATPSAPAAVSVDAPDISGLLKELKDLQPTGEFPADDAARDAMKAKAKQRDEVIAKLDKFVIEHEEQAAASTDPTTIANLKKNADVLRQQINTAKYVK